MAAQPNQPAWHVKEALRNFLLRYEGPHDDEAVARAFLEDLGDMYLRILALQAVPYIRKELSGDFRSEIRRFGDVRPSVLNSTSAPAVETGASSRKPAGRRRMRARMDWRHRYPLNVDGRQVMFIDSLVSDWEWVHENAALRKRYAADDEARAAAVIEYAREHGISACRDIPEDVAARLLKPNAEVVS